MKSLHKSLHHFICVAGRMFTPLGLLITLICLIPNGQCSPHRRNLEDRQFDLWDQPSGDLHPGILQEEEVDSSVHTNDHPTTAGGVGGGGAGEESGATINKHHVEGAPPPLSKVSIPSPGEAGLLSSSMIRITGDPRSQHQSRPVADVIQGSRRAFSITKLEYLKKEWCKTERFVQVIREEGCRKRVIINRFCYGQCNSFFIPKSNRNDPDWAAFKSCAFCRPRKSSNITVTLVCPNRRPRLKRKKVAVVKECRCMAQSLD